ncbi:MAG: serine/threonine protein kinase [Sulfolobaceae archaeon]
MVKIRNFIYPYFSEEIARELIEAGIEYAYSFGNVSIGKLRVIGKGKTGIVVLVDKDKVVKIRRVDSPKESLELEAKFQIIAGNQIAPKVYAYGKNFILMEYVKGRNLSKNENKEIVIDLLYRAKLLEEKFIEHKELSRPWRNVIVSNNRTYIIDYDSASIKEKPRNVSKLLSNYLNKRTLAIKYVKGDISFNELISIL